MKMLVNGVLVTEKSAIKFIANPKRVGSLAYDRYDSYQECETIGQYFEVCGDSKYAKADLRWDHDRAFMTILLEE